MSKNKRERSVSDTKNIWFTADLHLLHPKIVNICNRPISIEKHDQWLINRFNSKVNRNDTVYILGDVSMSNKIDTEKLLNKMNGNKHLILGNHDSNIKNSGIFKSISLIKNFNFNSKEYSNLHMVLCHYPIASWERKVHGSLHLHGHTHARFNNKGLSWDVGVDNNDYYPISLENVLDIITKKSLSLF